MSTTDESARVASVNPRATTRAQSVEDVVVLSYRFPHKYNVAKLQGIAAGLWEKTDPGKRLSLFGCSFVSYFNGPNPVIKVFLYLNEPRKTATL